MVQETDKIGRSTCRKPEIGYTLFAKRIQDTERIVNVQQVVTEMITVILMFQTLLHLSLATFISNGQRFNRFVKIAVEFLFRYTTERLIFHIHADIRRLIETAEYTDLGEFGHTRKQNETQMLVGCLENRIEAFQDIAVMFLQQAFLITDSGRHPRIKYIKKRFVVFIDKDNRTFSALLVCRFQHILKTATDILTIVIPSINILLIGQELFQYQFQHTRTGKIRSIEVDMKYRIFRPFLFQGINGQSLEKLIFPLKVIFQGRNKQTLTKTARAAKEVNLSLRNQPMNKSGLVYIYITTVDDTGEILYSNGIFHNRFIFLQI